MYLDNGCVYIRVNVFTYLYLHVCLTVYDILYMCVFMYLWCVYVCLHGCLHVCMYVCICMPIYLWFVYACMYDCMHDLYIYAYMNVCVLLCNQSRALEYNFSGWMTLKRFHFYFFSSLRRFLRFGGSFRRPMHAIQCNAMVTIFIYMYTYIGRRSKEPGCTQWPMGNFQKATPPSVKRPRRHSPYMYRKSYTLHIYIYESKYIIYMHS